MVYYDFLSYDFVTRQSVYFCRFQVNYLLFLALGLPFCWRSHFVGGLPSGPPVSLSFFWEYSSCQLLGRPCGVII